MLTVFIGIFHMKANFRDVKADILENITTGAWPPGSPIASEVDLAAEYGCARATVNRAMRELADEGLVERRRKAGSRVRKIPIRQANFDMPLLREEIERRGGRYQYALIARQVRSAPDWLRPRLRLTETVRFLHMTCMHYASSAPYQFEDRWINLEIAPQAETSDFDKVGPGEWLIRTMPFAEVQLSLSAQSADDVLAAHLDCMPGDALMHDERSTWWDGRAVSYARLYFSPGFRMMTTL